MNRTLQRGKKVDDGLEVVASMENISYRSTYQTASCFTVFLKSPSRLMRDNFIFIVICSLIVKFAA